AVCLSVMRLCARANAILLDDQYVPEVDSRNCQSAAYHDSGKHSLDELCRCDHAGTAAYLFDEHDRRWCIGCRGQYNRHGVVRFRFRQTALYRQEHALLYRAGNDDDSAGNADHHELSDDRTARLDEYLASACHSVLGKSVQHLLTKTNLHASA